MTDAAHVNTTFGPGADSMDTGVQPASSLSRKRVRPARAPNTGDIAGMIFQAQRDKTVPARSKPPSSSTPTSRSHSQIPSSSTAHPSSQLTSVPGPSRPSDRERERERQNERGAREMERQERDADRIKRDAERLERERERVERYGGKEWGTSVPGPSSYPSKPPMGRQVLPGRYEDEDDADEFSRDKVALRTPVDPAGRRGGRGVIYGDGRTMENPGVDVRRQARGLREFNSAPPLMASQSRQDDRSRDRLDDSGMIHPRQRTETGSRQPQSVTSGASSSNPRTLFDPHLPNPRRFVGSPSASGGSGTTGTMTSRTGGSSLLSGGGMLKKGSSLATSVSLEPRDRAGQERQGGKGGGRAHMDDEEGDRERERRRRREGSERGSQANPRKKEDDGKSRGSRSSEGSESLKDRERGRGKNDTGIMSRLREAYNVINTLEKSLIDIHKKLTGDFGMKDLVAAGMLEQGYTTAANIAGTGGTGQSFNPAQRGGAIGVLRQAMDEEEEYSRAPVPPRRKQVVPEPEVVDEEMEARGWVELCGRHKKLADAHHDFLTISLDPLIPASMHNLPVRYNIPARLWQTAFHLLLEKLRFTWKANLPSNNVKTQGYTATSRLAGADSHRDPEISARILDHLTDFIYDAYSFYTSLYEEDVLSNFKTAWIEALGDLARYKMAIAAQVTVNERAAALANPRKSRASVSSDTESDDDDDTKPAFPSGASIGAEVAESWDIEDRETWRTTARDWYVEGICEKPGEGRLHHHLALLCRDVKGDEGRALYHFAKSMTASHPYDTSRESILPLFDLALQRKRATPDATATELFILLHGMLFTRIELDNFDSVFDRFMERLEVDALIGTLPSWDPKQKPIPQVEWLIMAAVNLAAILQYGAPGGLLKKASAEEAAARRANRQEGANGAQAAVAEEGDEGDDQDGFDEPAVNPTAGEDGVVTVLKKLALSSNDEDEDGLPVSLRNALRLAFTVFEFCLRHPTRTIGLTSVLNPYITIFLTYLATALKVPAAQSILEKSIPWQALADFMNTTPKKKGEVNEHVPAKLMGGPPIPEDWCLRGMEWVGRKVYERGFWKQSKNSGGMSGGRNSGSSAQPRSGPKIQSEMDVLLAESDMTQADASEGVVDDVEGADLTDAPAAITSRRWKRVAWAAGVLTSIVPGFSFDSPHSRKLGIDIGGVLDRKINRWAAERAAVLEAERKRRRKEEESRGEWVEEVVSAEVEVESDGDDEGIDPEVRELRARRRYLRSLLATPHPAPTRTRIVATAPAKPAQTRPTILPGYTVLVFDTNVLLSSLELFSRTMERGKWTIVVPLPVVTELDGLAKAPAPLGPAASTAVTYLESHVRSHSTSLKIQTSKGNYLTNLAIRAENLYDNATPQNDVDAETARAQTLDDFILRVAAFHNTNFTDRSNILGTNSAADYEQKKKNAAKVLLLTFDRNLRLRARARGVDAADEKEMANILDKGT